MRTSTNRHWLGLIALALLALPLSTADAKDPVEAGTGPALWVFDVRVVRVYADPVRGLQPTPYEVHGSTTSTPWVQIRQTLAARGTTEVMLEQRLSTLAGIQAEAKTQSTFPVERFDTRSGGQETRRFDRIDSGSTVLLKAHDQLEYNAMARWLHWYPKEGAVPTATTSWKGTHAPLRAGQSLFLASRRHIRDAEGKSELAEIYTIISVVSAPR